jgi:hypothetical protein
MIEVEAKERARQSKELLSESTGERLPGGRHLNQFAAGRAPKNGGDCGERELNHSTGEAEKFYGNLKQKGRHERRSRGESATAACLLTALPNDVRFTSADRANKTDILTDVRFGFVLADSSHDGSCCT